MDDTIKLLLVCISMIYDVEKFDVCGENCICPLGGGEM